MHVPIHKITLIFITCFLFTVSASTTVPKKNLHSKSQIRTIPKSLVIVLDGVRSDALVQAHTPMINRLQANRWQKNYFCAWSYFARPVEDAAPNSGPNHVAILTGAPLEIHGITKNRDLQFIRGTLDSVQNYLDLLKECNSKIKTAFLYEWPIDRHIPYNGEFFQNDSDEKNTKTLAKMYHKGINHRFATVNPGPDAAFLLIDGPDRAGHSFGFYPFSREYLTAISIADRQIASILEAISARPGFLKENWQIIITSDHGGRGRHHGFEIADNRTIPFLIVSTNFPGGHLTGTVHNYDTTVNVLNHFACSALPANYAPIGMLLSADRFRETDTRTNKKAWLNKKLPVPDELFLSKLQGGMAVGFSIKIENISRDELPILIAGNTNNPAVWTLGVYSGSLEAHITDTAQSEQQKTHQVIGSLDLAEGINYRLIFMYSTDGFLSLYLRDDKHIYFIASPVNDPGPLLKLQLQMKSTDLQIKKSYFLTHQLRIPEIKHLLIF